MTSSAPLVTFFRLIEAARPPERADRAAIGTLPTRSYRYCDAVTSASGFGWYVYAPMEFDLLYDGEQVFWTFAGTDGWMPLDSAQFPDQSAAFDAAAPAAFEGYSPPFLSAFPEAGVVQIWTGLIARAAPDWNLLVRPPANLWVGGGFVTYEGVLESDRWFGPLFTNIRITKTDVPIRIGIKTPLVQVQPIPRALFGDDVLGRMAVVGSMADFTPEDWAAYEQSVVLPSQDLQRPIGAYAIDARKRRRGECPHLAATRLAEQTGVELPAGTYSAATAG